MQSQGVFDCDRRFFLPFLPTVFFFENNQHKNKATMKELEKLAMLSAFADIPVTEQEYRELEYSVKTCTEQESEKYTIKRSVELHVKIVK